MPHVEVEPGVLIHAQDVGRGPPVVLIAGFGLSHEVWDGQVRVLGADHRVVCIDVRGTGRSDKPMGGYGMDRLVRDVRMVLDELDLRDVALVGWSFGAQISLRLAATAPERVARLALVGSNAVRASRSDEFPFGPDAVALEAALVRAECNARITTRRRTVGSGFHVEPDPDVLDWLVRCQLQMPSWAAVASYHTYLHTDLVADLAAVTIPVVQIMGDKDPVSLIEGAPWVQERLHDARLVTLENCGHYPMFEACERFDAALMDFVGTP